MGAAPAPPLSPSSARPTGASRPCCFAVEMVQVYPLEPILQMRMSRPSVFRLGLLSARLLSAGSRDEPQWVFPILLPPPILTVLCPACEHPLLAKRKRSRTKWRVMPRLCWCHGQWSSHKSPAAPPSPTPGDLLNQDRNSSPRPDMGPAGFCPSPSYLIKQVLEQQSLISAIGFERLPPHFCAELEGEVARH